MIEAGLVRNQDEKAYFFLTNAYDCPINIEIPVIKLISVERLFETLSLETHSDDKINKRKEFENIVLKTDKSEKNHGSHDVVKKEKNFSSLANVKN